MNIIRLSDLNYMTFTCTVNELYAGKIQHCERAPFVISGLNYVTFTCGVNKRCTVERNQSDTVKYSDFTRPYWTKKKSASLHMQHKQV